MLTRLPASAGVGLKLEHVREMYEAQGRDGLWAEVHAENYMVDGGPRLAWLELIAQRRPVSLHGVGLSLAGPDPLDEDHLQRWRRLTGRIDAAAVSEHASWSVADGEYFADLLPAAATRAALDRLCANIERMQTALGRTILIENAAHYLPLKGDMAEPDFLAEACRRTGCGLILDLNNIFVSARNLGRDALTHLDAVDPAHVGEIHIAGHAPDPVYGELLLIDTHGAPVAAGVWDLLDRALARFGPRPVLIERDAALPPFTDLIAERDRAAAAIAQARTPVGDHV